MHADTFWSVCEAVPHEIPHSNISTLALNQVRSVIKGGALRLPVGERDGDDGGAPAAGWALGDRVYRGYARSGSGGGVEDGLSGPCGGEGGCAAERELQSMSERENR